MSVKHQILKRRADQILKNGHGKRIAKPNKDTAKFDHAIRLYLMLARDEPIGEHELRECERKLGLPKIRLRLEGDVPFSSHRARKRRIHDCLPPSITRHTRV